MVVSVALSTWRLGVQSSKQQCDIQRRKRHTGFKLRVILLYLCLYLSSAAGVFGVSLLTGVPSVYYTAAIPLLLLKRSSSLMFNVL